MGDPASIVRDTGIVPVIKIDDAANAVPLARALAEGGIPIAEITFRTPAAAESIRRIASEVPEMLLGAGTVVTVEQAREALNAGAHFVVSPGFGPEVSRFCLEKGVPVFPGVATATDIQAALDLGLRTLKFFPAEALGGVATLTALSGPFGQVSFIPLGGVNTGNMNTYLAHPKVVAIGGTWLVRDETDPGSIRQAAAEAMMTMLGFEVAHLGINAADPKESMEITGAFSRLFNFPLKEGNSSNFAGPGIEVNKKPGAGRLGHLAIATNSLPRAMAWLERKGIEVSRETLKKGPTGEPVAVYLAGEIGGFAVHLLQKKREK